jgi:hypothetical protein
MAATGKTRSTVKVTVHCFRILWPLAGLNQSATVRSSPRSLATLRNGSPLTPAQTGVWNAGRLTRMPNCPGIWGSFIFRISPVRSAECKLLHPAATPHGSLTLTEAPLIDAENLFRRPGPPQTEAKEN